MGFLMAYFTNLYRFFGELPQKAKALLVILSGEISYILLAGMAHVDFRVTFSVFLGSLLGFSYSLGRVFNRIWPEGQDRPDLQQERSSQHSLAK